MSSFLLLVSCYSVLSFCANIFCFSDFSRCNNSSLPPNKELPNGLPLPEIQKWPTSKWAGRQKERRAIDRQSVTSQKNGTENRIPVCMFYIQYVLSLSHRRGPSFKSCLIYVTVCLGPSIFFDCSRLLVS